MKEQKKKDSSVLEPRELEIDLSIEKNLWLTRIRWLYTAFVFVLFFIYNFFSEEFYIGYRPLLFIAALAIVGNLLFKLTLEKNKKLPDQQQHISNYTKLAAIQLDFDLVVLALFIFYSGGFDSPVTVLFIFYIMIATFLVYHEMAFKNMLTAIALVLLIFFTDNNLAISPGKFAEKIVFVLILFFAFYIASFLAKSLRDNEQSLHEFLQKSGEFSVIDELTGLYNHAHFFLMFKLHMEKARRYDSAFSLVIFNIDHFKNYNDKNGHDKGSELLGKIAERMRKVFRVNDILCRYGGDEFVVILPKSDRVGAYLAADRLREVIEQEPFPGSLDQPQGKVTISMGIASFPEHGNSAEELLKNAQKALHMAKSSGRNRAVIYDPRAGKKEPK